MKTANPAAYRDLLELDLTTPLALGQPFRSILLVTSTAGLCTFDITTVAGDVKSLTIRLVANQSFILPLAGNDIIKTSGGIGFNAYALM